MAISAPRGTKDLLPGEVERWQYIEQVARDLSRSYGYQEIRTPIFEHTELFLRGIGDATDIVQKEMYTFEDRGGRSITLRPEGTAAVVRSYLEHHLDTQPQPVKLYYIGPMFRYDRPQAGRYRQFHQVGIEAFGSNDPSLDAEIVSFTWDYFQKLGLTDIRVEINSVGCPGCRPAYGRALQRFVEPYSGSLCDFCRDRLGRNPLRLLDCKDTGCQEILADAPRLKDYMCDDCRMHFEKVQNYLQVAGVPVTVNEKLVRGLDYYTNTAFEVTCPGLGAQSSVAGGGRYNNLVETVGGPSVPGIGVAIGLERVLLALEKKGVPIPIEAPEIIFVATAGEGDFEAFRLMTELRRWGFTAEKDFLGRSLKAQMKSAGRMGARYVLLLGEEELREGKVTLRDMTSGTQTAVKREELFKVLAELRNRRQ
ncbi:MAG TPA: histidine--tRNA ligase [Syntrophomonadaceae bacterium]|nr:histidine--tRNA ligase [Syntrophomonadaceae bacterium]